MENCPSELRKRAIDVVLNNSEIGFDEINLRKFFYYLECFCVELKQTEFDVLLNDENYDFFYNLFESVMIKKSDSAFDENAKVTYYSYL